MHLDQVGSVLAEGLFDDCQRLAAACGVMGAFLSKAVQALLACR